MATIQEIEDAIFRVEGFRVEIEPSDQNGIANDLRDYCVNKYNDRYTVNTWRRKIFLGRYPKYTVYVYKGYSDVAYGNTLLRTVRDSYDFLVIKERFLKIQKDIQALNNKLNELKFGVVNPQDDPYAIVGVKMRM